MDTGTAHGIHGAGRQHVVRTSKRRGTLLLGGWIAAMYLLILGIGFGQDACGDLLAAASDRLARASGITLTSGQLASRINLYLVAILQSVGILLWRASLRKLDPEFLDEIRVTPHGFPALRRALGTDRFNMMLILGSIVAWGIVLSTEQRFGVSSQFVLFMPGALLSVLVLTSAASLDPGGSRLLPNSTANLATLTTILPVLGPLGLVLQALAIVALLHRAKRLLDFSVREAELEEFRERQKAHATLQPINESGVA